MTPATGNRETAEGPGFGQKHILVGVERTVWSTRLITRPIHTSELFISRQGQHFAQPLGGDFVL